MLGLFWISQALRIFKFSETNFCYKLVIEYTVFGVVV